METYLVITTIAGMLDGVEHYTAYDQAIGRMNELAHEWRYYQIGYATALVCKVTETYCINVEQITSGEYIEGETAA